MLVPVIVKLHQIVLHVMLDLALHFIQQYFSPIQSQRKQLLAAMLEEKTHESPGNYTIQSS